MNHRRAALWVATCFVTLVVASPRAYADDKQDCAAASDNGQKLRDDGKLIKASEQFLVCARDVCPATIKKDCADWLSKAQASLPTVVLDVKDARGQEISNAKVTLDDQPTNATLDGKGMFIDPGKHTFRFEAAGQQPLETQILIHEGEKNRLVSVSLQPDHPPPQSDLRPAVATPPHTKSKVPAIVVGGLGIAALGVGTVFGIVGTGGYNDLANGCGKTKTCSSDDTSPVKTKLVLADVFVGVGVVAVAAAVVLYVMESRSTTETVGASKPTSPTPKIDVAVLPGGGAAMFGASF